MSGLNPPTRLCDCCDAPGYHHVKSIDALADHARTSIDNGPCALDPSPGYPLGAEFDSADDAWSWLHECGIRYHLPSRTRKPVGTAG